MPTEAAEKSEAQRRVKRLSEARWHRFAGIGFLLAGAFCLLGAAKECMDDPTTLHALGVVCSAGLLTSGAGFLFDACYALRTEGAKETSIKLFGAILMCAGVTGKMICEGHGTFLLLPSGLSLLYLLAVWWERRKQRRLSVVSQSPSR